MTDELEKMSKSDQKLTINSVLNQLFESNPDLKLSALFMEIFMWSYNDKQGILSHKNDSQYDW